MPELPLPYPSEGIPRLRDARPLRSHESHPHTAPMSSAGAHAPHDASLTEG
jgi:hypothetical protein